jgi:hypothetical protein
MTLVPCANLGGDHCDFCQSSPVFTVYPCSNFLHNGLPVFPGRTTGTWATKIVTNYHVIKEAHSAIVKLSNGAFFPVAGVLASEADKDLAIIKSV